MFTTRFAEADIRRAVDACRSGRHPSDVGRDFGVSERTVHRWRRRFPDPDDAGEADPVVLPAPATAMPPPCRIFAAMGDVALVTAPIAGPVPLAEAGMRWGGQALPEPLVFSIVGDPEQGYHLLALGRVPGAVLAAGAEAPELEVHTATGDVVVSATGIVIEALVPADGIALPQLPDFVRQRALRVLAETGGTFLKLHEDPSFAGLCRALTLGIVGRPAAWGTVLSLGGRLHYCVGEAGFDPDDVRGVLLIGSRGVRRNPFLPQRRSATGRRMQLVVDRAEGLGPGRVLVLCIGYGPPSCFVLEADAAAPTTALHRHLQEEPDEALVARHYLLRCLRPYIRANAPLRALLRESLTLIPQTAPAVAAGRGLAGEIDLAIGFADGGLFVRGWLADPQGVVADLQLLSAFEEIRTIEPTRLTFPRNGADGRRRPGPDDGFVAFFPELQPVMADAPVRLRARLSSGAMIELPAAAVIGDAERGRQELLGAVPPNSANDAMMEHCLAPAIAAAIRDVAAEAGAGRVERLGPMPDTVDWSIVVPLYRSLELLPAQFAALAADPDMARAELILVLDSPEQEEDLRRALHGLGLIYGLPVTLVVNRRNLGYAGAVNAGAAHARGRWLVPLNSDVLPRRPGWLSALRRGLLPGIGAVGPLLLFPDDTIQHAGLYYDRGTDGSWLNRHFLKGLPRGSAGASQPREVPGVTGACFVIATETFRKLGGFCTDFAIGDYEDSDLCLRLREMGLRLWYAPEAELYHLERHSIQQHVSYGRGIASRHNRWLHGRRWDAAMTRLMEDPTRWALARRGDWRRSWLALPEAPAPAAADVSMVA